MLCISISNPYCGGLNKKVDRDSPKSCRLGCNAYKIDQTGFFVGVYLIGLVAVLFSSEDCIQLHAILLSKQQHGFCSFVLQHDF